VPGMTLKGVHYRVSKSSTELHRRKADFQMARLEEIRIKGRTASTGSLVRRDLPRDPGVDIVCIARERLR